MIQQAWESQRWQARRRIARLAEQAIEVLAKALDGQAKATRLSAAREVLNHILKEPPKAQTHGAHRRVAESFGTCPCLPARPKRIRYDLSLVPPGILDRKI